MDVYRRQEEAITCSRPNHPVITTQQSHSQLSSVVSSPHLPAFVRSEATTGTETFYKIVTVGHKRMFFRS